MLNINITITTLDEKLARLLEPRAPRPELRLEAVRKLRSAGSAWACTPTRSCRASPIPTSRWTRVARAARDAGAMSFGGGALFLPGAAQKVFLPFLDASFRTWPRAIGRHSRTISTSAALTRMRLGERVRRIRERYGLASGHDRVPAGTLGRGGATGPLSATVKAGCNLPISTTTCPRN